jgi:hypothetical protein
MMRAVLFFVLLFATPAFATVTIRNFDGVGTGVNNQVTRFDTKGNAVDAHDGEIFQDPVSGTYYWYGTSYGCGFRWQISGSPFCGFKAYSSTDLVNWTDQGFLFDATGSTWQTRCNGTAGGCFRPHVVYNAATMKYVLWFNGGTATNSYYVFTADAPTGPWTEQSQPSHLTATTGGNGDENLFVDPADGTAYLVYTNVGSGATFDLYIDKLNSNYTDVTGTGEAIGAPHYKEAPGMFKRGSTYYYTYGTLCGYCGLGADTSYFTASTPLGSWTPQGAISSDSCHGQSTNVSVITTNSGTVYLYQSDLWKSTDPTSPLFGWANQGQANQFWRPLAFSGSAINPINCDPAFTLDLTPAPPPPLSGIDQSTEGNSFVTHCGGLDIGSSIIRLQTFTPSRSGTLSQILFTTAQGNASCSVSSCPGVNAGFTLDFMNVDQNTSLPTGTTLASAVLPLSSAAWSPTVFDAPIGVAVTAGTKYGIRVSSGTGIGCYTWNSNDQNVYSRGLEFYSTNGGISYNVETGRALKFATVIDTPLDTFITSNPPALTNSTSATFGFASTDPASTFSCSLDSGSFASCLSPKTYSGLSAGSHNFQVKATDSANNTDPTPASYSWTIDITPPDTMITSSPPSITSSTTASFSFISTKNPSTFACSLDGSPFTGCASPMTYNGLSNSSHTFQVLAIDAAGNFDPSPASYTWTISTADITPPNTTITSAPASVTKQTKAVFTFASTEAGSTFACALDTSTFTSCASPLNYNKLGRGPHTFSVYAIDAAGNKDPSPATFTWTIQ